MEEIAVEIEQDWGHMIQLNTDSLRIGRSISPAAGL